MAYAKQATPKHCHMSLIHNTSNYKRTSNIYSPCADLEMELQDPITFEPLRAPMRVLSCCGNTLNHNTLIKLILMSPQRDVFDCPLCRRSSIFDKNSAEYVQFYISYFYSSYRTASLTQHSFYGMARSQQFPRNRTLESLADEMDKTQATKKVNDSKDRSGLLNEVLKTKFEPHYFPIVNKLAKTQHLSFALVALQSLGKDTS